MSTSAFALGYLRWLRGFSGCSAPHNFSQEQEIGLSYGLLQQNHELSAEDLTGKKNSCQEQYCLARKPTFKRNLKSHWVFYLKISPDCTFQESVAAILAYHHVRIKHVIGHVHGSRQPAKAIDRTSHG
jgi:hypothetical protein